MHACHGASAACRPEEMGRLRGEIGSDHRSIHVGRRLPNRRQRVNNTIWHVITLSAILSHILSGQLSLSLIYGQ